MLIRIFALFGLVLLSACGRPGGPPPGTPDEVTRLASRIVALSPSVDPEEATRAAQITYDTTYQLAQAYQITDPPIIHNMKVNSGLKPRGLCYHWAEDLEARLVRENLETLDLHRAIANADNPFRIEHSTAIISAEGADMFSGIVVDPWRKGGVLFWAPVTEDRRYKWRPRLEVLRKKRDRLLAEQEAHTAR